VTESPRGRRIDRIRDAAFVRGLSDLSIEELRRRRDECLIERDHLSMIRRLVQGRAEILQAELTSRGTQTQGPLVDRLAEILAPDDHPVTSRGEAVRVGVPEDEMLLARRRVERLVSDAAISNPTALDDDDLASAIETLAGEEQNVSEARAEVIRALDAVQDELKRRYKDDPSLALS
jgi:anti-sigma-K factor RsiG